MSSSRLGQAPASLLGLHLQMPPWAVPIWEQRSAQALPLPLCWLHPLLGMLVLGGPRAQTEPLPLWPGTLCPQRQSISWWQPWVPAGLSPWPPRDESSEKRFRHLV